ncbi:conserved hypothetical protein [Methylobacterium sp. 4-46]|uniref:nuclear transport factor 2 family protein n=1 Tax=unclassified Methylobacterium TaxID=2615210 RepID=UPI000152D19B|nr:MULTISPECIES: nuclear transport factor 2 family protein [Methylobacterium]ACA19668.1 conserved hypothetical protein [Methylobacterium sp. 4-46]WFT78865.1 nuclear transport factor 2 family protein [Methylobacterium nodulans]
MTSEEGTALIRAMFEAFCDLDRPVEEIAAYFAPGYVQRVDGREFGREGFLDHLRALRTTLRRLDFVIEQIVCDGASAASVHVAHALKRTGEAVRVKVIAFYKLEHGQISLVDELTRLVHGDASDRDLAFVRHA